MSVIFFDKDFICSNTNIYIYLFLYLVSLRLSNEYFLWNRGATGFGAPFEIQLRLHYPMQTVTYYTGFWQMLKWAWVQYISILIVFIFFFRQVKIFVFSKQVLPAIMINPFVPKDHFK